MSPRQELAAAAARYLAAPSVADHYEKVLARLVAVGGKAVVETGGGRVGFEAGPGNKWFQFFGVLPSEEAYVEDEQFAAAFAEYQRAMSEASAAEDDFAKKFPRSWRDKAVMVMDLMGANQ